MNDTNLTGSDRASDAANWKQIVARYQQPSVARAVWQLVNTLVPYIGLWALMHFTMAISWWLTIPLAILAGAILVRAFIIFHDCGHGSFFKSPTANHIFGAITGVFTFTPFYHWRWEHAIHHSSSGDLDRRGTGDVWTMTVQEYLVASRWKRFAYRLARNPVILFVVAPLVLFLVLERLVTSPLLRARQTAEEVLEHLSSPTPELHTCDHLAPGGKRRKLTRFLRGLGAQSVAIVGHMPDLGLYASWLIGSKKVQIDLAKAGAACIHFEDKPDKAEGVLTWLVTPQWCK